MTNIGYENFKIAHLILYNKKIVVSFPVGSKPTELDIKSQITKKKVKYWK